MNSRKEIMMKRKSLCLALALLLCLPLAGCRSAEREAVESEILALREENMAKAEGLLAEEETASAEPEEALSGGETYAPPKTDWDHILSSEYTVYDNKIYYNLQSYKTIPSPYGKGQNTGALIMHAYTDLSTLESSYLCPDPLCRHDDLHACLYTDWSSSSPVLPADDRTVYMARKVYDNEYSGFVVWKADLAGGRQKVVYTPKDGDLPGLVGVDRGVLYLVDSKDVTDTEDRITDTTNYLIGISVATDEIVSERKMPEDCRILFIRNSKIVYATTKELAECDLSFGNSRTLFEFQGRGAISAWYYDEYRDEMWILTVKSGYESGKIWRIASDGAAEEVVLPVPSVIFFQLTNSKIYYCAYDPLKLGEHPSDPNGTVDKSGGKIYAVDRNDPAGKAELVYDTHGETFLCNPGVNTYAVFGDQLFFRPALLVDYRDPLTGKNYKVMSIANDLFMHRVDLTTGEEEIIRFD